MDADRARAMLNADLAHVAGGDAEAMRRVYNATHSKLFGVCLRIIGDHGQAEDVVQDVYLKIWNRAPAFDAARASPITWMCAIARNASIDVRRATRRRGIDVDGGAIDEAADPEPGIDQVMERDEDRRRAVDCLDTLSHDQSRTIRAAFLGGLSYIEVARAQRVPIGTAKSWIRRGLRQLRVAMAENG